MTGILREAGVEQPALKATILLAEYGSIGRALAASRRRVGKVAGREVVTALSAFRARMLHILWVGVDERPVLSSSDLLLRYLHAAMAFETIEQLRLLHLNVRNRLLLDEVISRGSIDQTTVHVREVIVRALEVGSASIIIVHNHPSGDPSPSRADIEITRAIINAGKAVDVTVHDHLIIGTTGHVSLRARGLI